MKSEAERIEEIRRTAAKIAERLNTDRRFRRKVEQDPVKTLYRAGLPISALGQFLKESGAPGLDTEGFEPKTEADLEAAWAVSAADWQHQRRGDVLCIFFTNTIPSTEYPECTLGWWCHAGKPQGRSDIAPPGPDTPELKPKLPLRPHDDTIDDDR